VQNTNYETIINLIAQIISDGKTVNEYPVEIGITPTIIVDNTNFNQLPLMMYGKAINKVIFDHGITTTVLHRIYKILENPQGIYHSDSTIQLKGSIVVVTKETIRGDQLIVVIQPDINVGHKTINRIVSIYGKPTGVIQGWEAKGLRIFP
jgi:Phage MuF-C-terminal domain